MALLIDNINNDISIEGGGTPTLNGKSPGDQAGFTIGEPITTEPTVGTNGVGIGEAAVATGTHAVAVGANTSATAFSAIAIGTEATADANYAIAIGNTANASVANAVAFGSFTDATASAAIACGHYAQATGSNSIALGSGTSEATAANATATGAIAIGYDTLANATDAIAFGYQASATAQGAVAIGTGAVADQPNMVAFGYGGNYRVGFQSLVADTTDATQTELASVNSGYLVIPSDASTVFSIYVTARRTDVDGESAAYLIEGCIDNNAGTTALVGTPTVTVIAEDTAAWDVVVEADDTNDRLAVKVTGEAAKTIRWLARVEFTEVTG
jgi:hypothetical protein